MPKVDRETLRKVEAALERFKAEVNDHPLLKPNTKIYYTSTASAFVRWLDDDFEPGQNLRR